MNKLHFIFLFLLAGLFACEKGDLLDNLAPESKISVTEMNVTGQDRLNSIITLHWSGEDKDGYVKSYELSFDQTNWFSTTKQDSTFRFSINSGSDTTDISFYVRAIDDKGTKDASPAFLKIPIRNTAPKIAFDTQSPIPDTVYSVLTTLWNSSDLDGNETLDSVFIKANAGKWYALPQNISFLTLVPENPKNIGVQNAKVYKNSVAELLSARIEGLNVGAVNQLYLKVKDKAGSFSQVDSSINFYLMPQTADVLVVDEYNLTGTPTPEEIYNAIFTNLGITHDIYKMSGNAPKFWEPTFSLYLSLYDKVFWYSDGIEQQDFANQLYLELAATALQKYLNQGGKMLISARFPARFNTKATAYESAIFSYSPFDSLSTSAGQARIPTDSSVLPVNMAAATYPTLKPSVFLTGVDPFYAKNPSQNMYHAQIQGTGGWVGPRSIIGSTLFSNGKINQVFVSVELHKLNGDAAALQSFFNKVLNEEFNW
ncbi:MAG: hypothetical protein ACKVTZ_11250 [Bacteroidia bacterium]